MSARNDTLPGLTALGQIGRLIEKATEDLYDWTERYGHELATNPLAEDAQDWDSLEALRLVDALGTAGGRHEALMAAYKLRLNETMIDTYPGDILEIARAVQAAVDNLVPAGYATRVQAEAYVMDEVRKAYHEGRRLV